MQTHGDPTCRTKLVWRPRHLAGDIPPEINILVHRDVVARQIWTIPADSPAIAGFSQYGIFAGTHEGSWGFGGSLLLAPETDDGFVPFICKLPRAKKFCDEDCESCGGTGRDEDRGDDCLRCAGSGHPTHYDYAEILAISASITLLTDAVTCFPPEENTSATSPQLISFITSTAEGNYSLNGEYGKTLMDWLKSLSRQPIIQVSTAMLMSYDQMMIATGDDARSISAEITDDRQLILRGHSTDYFVSPNMDQHSPAGSCKFSSHYMDNPALTLMFLAGLAQFEMLSRKVLKL